MLLGIDIGGTTISLGLIEGGKIVRSECVSSFPAGASQAETIDYLTENIRKIFTPAVDAIGIGVPSVVDVEKGIVYDACNIPSWDEVHLKEELEGRFGIPVSVNNDSNCFALGAAHSLEQPAKVVTGITLGTGTGVGVVLDGKLFSGPNCGVGELGSVPYNGSIFEAFCSKQFFENRGWNGKAASDAAKRGEEAALEMFREFGRHMGEFLALVMYAYDPDCIILGGGLANSFDLFRDSMMETLSKRYIYPNSLRRLRVMAMTQENLALLGASLLGI